jgi:DNA adenine methylase
LFFVDPPYWNCEGDYGPKMFSKADFGLLKSLLEGLKGRFIMTINDLPETRAMFKVFNIEPVAVRYSVGGAGTPQGRELIISNV